MYPLNRILRIADPVLGGEGATPAPAPAGGDYVDNMVAEMNAASAAEPAAPEIPPAPAAGAPPVPKPASAAPKSVTPPPAAKPAAKAPAAPAAKPAAPPAKPVPSASPVEKPLDWKSAPEQFRAAHEKLVQVHQQETTRLTTELSQTTGKMRELEGKKFLSPDQERKYAQLEKDQQDLRADLYARDYKESPEFKAKYDAKSKVIFNRVDRNLKSLQVDDGNGNQRPAVPADFNKIVGLGENPIEQRRQAKAMFGEDADVVLADARELQTLHEQANEEITAKRTGYASERQKQAQQSEQEREQGMQAYTEYDGLLEQKFPQYFAPIEGNDAYNKAREEGLKYVDGVGSNLSSKTPAERAQQTALMRRWAASFPATQILLQQRGDEIQSLKDQIAKLQGTDPGALGEGGASGGGGGEDKGGTDTMIDELNKAIRGT